MEKIREATPQERKKFQEFYEKETGDDYDGFRIGVIDDYISDCPGCVGKLFFVVGGYPGAFQLIANWPDGSLEQVKQETCEPARTNAEKFKEALRLLTEVNEDWNEDEVESYPADLPNFDELVSSMNLIEFAGAGIGGGQ